MVSLPDDLLAVGGWRLWAAAARHHGLSLTSADRQLLEADLADSPTAAASRMHLFS